MESLHYPALFLGRSEQRYNFVGTNYDGIADTTLERSLFENDFFPANANMGITLGWTDIPLPGLPGTIAALDLAYVPIRDGQVTDIDSDDSKGFVGAIQVTPFKLSKNKWLEGLNIGFGYFIDKANRDTAGGNSALGARDFRIRLLENINRIHVFRLETRGHRQVFTPSLQWRVGPYRFGAAYDFAKAERDFTGSLGGAQLDDAEVRTFIIRNGLWIWGPKGWLTGSEAGGVLLGYTFNRADTDAGSDFATRNSFSAFRRNSILSHIFALKYLPARNMAYTFQWNMYDIAKMAGAGATPTDTRQHLGLGQGGGTYHAITLDVQYRF